MNAAAIEFYIIVSYKCAHFAHFVSSARALAEEVEREHANLNAPTRAMRNSFENTAEETRI